MWTIGDTELPMSMLKLTGWVEVDGHRLTAQDIEEILRDSPDKVLTFGGEFFLAGSGCRARDHFGIMPGNCPKGTLICDGDSQRQDRSACSRICRWKRQLSLPWNCGATRV